MWPLLMFLGQNVVAQKKNSSQSFLSEMQKQWTFCSFSRENETERDCFQSTHFHKLLFFKQSIISKSGTV